MGHNRRKRGQKSRDKVITSRRRLEEFFIEHFWQERTMFPAMWSCQPVCLLACKKCWFCLFLWHLYNICNWYVHKETFFIGNSFFFFLFLDPPGEAYSGTFPALTTSPLERSALFAKFANTSAPLSRLLTAEDRTAPAASGRHEWRMDAVRPAASRVNSTSSRVNSSNSTVTSGASEDVSEPAALLGEQAAREYIRYWAVPL